jgi:protein-tyrosine phosphatase
MVGYGKSGGRMRICFVCQGNIIRSPLAENLFRHMVEEKGLSGKYQLDSAGTSAYHAGETPDQRMRQVAAKHGFEYTGRARQFWPEDLDKYDLLIAMDQNNRRFLESLAEDQTQLNKIRMMREFDPQGSEDLDVPDPYYGGLDGFEITFQIVKRSTLGLLEALESELLTP